MSSEHKDDQITAWREHNNRFYEELVRERGEGHQAFWGNKESQTTRFEVFLRHLPLSGKTVLEVGCGFGDFFGYCRHKGVGFSRYLGVDLDPVILAGAKERQPEAEFVVMDVLREAPPFRPDFIVASGITAVQFDGYEEYVLLLLERFHALCGSGFALNFLSTCSTRPDERSQYTRPGWLLDRFQERVDWRCLLVHDYRPNDFTLVHLRPEAAANRAHKT